MQITYPYKKLAAYPHLKPADVAIWERFIDKYPNAYSSVQYDLNVGEGRGQVSHDDPSMVKSWGMLTSQKIDVIGICDDHVDIIEIKPHARTNAIGQVLCYEILYLGYIDPFAETQTVIITDEKMNDMSLLCAHHNIGLVIV